jgi:hypothetical protein
VALLFRFDEAGAEARGRTVQGRVLIEGAIDPY